MKISSTNNYPDVASTYLIAADNDLTQDPDAMLTGDYSTSFNSAGVSSTFRVLRIWLVNFFRCGYIAIAGHNFGDIGGNLKVTITGAGVVADIDFAKGDRNAVVMITDFNPGVINSLDIVFTKLSSSDKVRVSYISAGDLMEFSSTQNNEQAGYQRLWRVDSKSIRTVVNENSQPVAYIRQTIVRDATLSIRNVAVEDTDTDNWYDWLDRIYKFGDFFIKEDDGDTVNIPDNPLSSYMCFAAEMRTPKAHASTRKLNSISVRFKAFTGH